MNIQKIMQIIDDHEERLRKLEISKHDSDSELSSKPKTKKQLTLAEIIKNKKFNSGQQKVTIIVGYYEKIQPTKPIKESTLRLGWKVGKFDGKYNSNLLSRAIKDGLVRNIDGDLDLSQTGEKFWEEFIS